jgi:DNA adenine methylase
MNDVINNNPNLKPFLKWPGGKRQLLPELKKYMPVNYKRYFEPFVGAGAMLFDLQPKGAMINDYNTELINCYRVIRSAPDRLIEILNTFKNNESFYYQLRSYNPVSLIEQAARTIFLNKTCFNGLYRLNSKGQFNASYGFYKNEFKPDTETIQAASQYLNQKEIFILNQDFSSVVLYAQAGDFVYFDPPYDVISKTANFTGYTSTGFTRDDQIRLHQAAIKLTENGISVMISNSNTEFIDGLYSDPMWHIHEIQAKRNINCDGAGRGKVTELIVTNYSHYKEAAA